MTKNLQQNIQTAELSDLMDMVCKEMKNDPEGFEEMKVDHHTPVGSKSKISFKNIKNYQNYSVLNKWQNEIQNKSAPKSKWRNA